MFKQANGQKRGFGWRKWIVPAVLLILPMLGQQEPCNQQPSSTCNSNGVCEANENCSTCPSDCGNCCGNGKCDAGFGESCDNCAADCGCSTGDVCYQGTCCAPKTCIGLSMECGQASDGCGGTLNCGACGRNQACTDGKCTTPPQKPNPTPVTLTSTYFSADATAPQGVSAWAIANYPNALPQNERSTIFWGRFQNNSCSSPGYGSNVEHPLSIPGITVFDAFYPDCSSNYGPSVDAIVYANDAVQHLLRSDITPGGAFQSFGPSGQNSTGANAYIQGIYTSFNPPWQANVPNRLHPWGGPSTDPDRIRFALRIQASVTKAVLDDPNHQQIQQTLWINVINEACSISNSSSYCQLQFNFKIFNLGKGAYTTFTQGSAFNDGGQGGLIAVVGPIADTGQSTSVSGSPAWTSWGSSTQTAPYQDKTFQVEVSWNQFQQLLMNVTNNNPSAVYGSKWRDRNSWTMINVGYGLENYNPSSTARSIVTGLFKKIEVYAL